MWTLHYYEDDILKAKEFPDKEGALRYGVRTQLRGQTKMEQLISPDKEVVMDTQALQDFYVSIYDKEE